MSLSSVLNTLDDAIHEVLDKCVNECIGPCISEKPGCADYMFLLQAIMEFLNGTLNSNYCDFHIALALIKKILQIPRQRTMEDTLHRAFVAPYHRNAVDTFHEYLEHNNKKFAQGSDGGPPRYYGKYCSIIQSSGTGKSCLMLEAFQLKMMHQLRYWNTQALTLLIMAFGAVHSLWLFSQQSTHLFQLPGAWKMCSQITGHAPGVVAADTAHNLLLSEQVTRSMPSQEVVINAYWDMVNLLDKLFGSGECHKPKFVIALDEAHSLNGMIDDFNGVSMDEQLVYPPYCQLGWDQFADPLEWITAMDVAQACHIIGYEQVLWKSILELHHVEGLMALAMSKLCGTRTCHWLPYLRDFA
ncbi:hypothetical protein EDC04DRAFT_2611229 [Pisolithus marmoratus]|nr:hypothetical protein EDC04DRAFT_2611229 [Pisolithus marmoratus]